MFKKLLIVQVISFICSVSFAQESLINTWAGLSSNINFAAVDYDSDNNLYVSGYHDNQADVDFSSNIYISGVINQTSQSFVAKYDDSGELIWVKAFFGEQDPGSSFYSSMRIFKLEVDVNGDIVCVGSFVGHFDFDPGNDSYFLQSTFGSNSFIMKLSSTGEFMWAKALQGLILTTGNQGQCSSTASSLSTDQYANIAIGGWFQGNVDFDPGTNVYAVQSSVYITYGGYALKLDPNGQFVWQRTYNSYNNDGIIDVQFDNENKLLIAGYFYDSLNVSSIYLDTTMLSSFSPGNYFFNAKLDMQGQEMWINRISVASNSSLNRIRVDNEGNLYVAGGFFNTIVFSEDSNIYTFHPTVDPSFGQWGSDGFLVKYNSQGDYQWAKTIGTYAVDYIFDFDILENGNIVFGAYGGDFSSQSNLYYDEQLILSLQQENSCYLIIDPNGGLISHVNLRYQGKRLITRDDNAIIVLGKVNTTASEPFDFDPDPNAAYYCPEIYGYTRGFMQKFQAFNVDGLDGNIVVGPNPTESKVNILLKEYAENCKISVFSSAGDEILTIENANKFETIDLQEFRNGLYFIQVTSGEENSNVKIVKF